MARCMSSASDYLLTQWAMLLVAHNTKDAAMAAHQEISPQSHHSTQPLKTSDPHPGWLAEWYKARDDFDVAGRLPGGGDGDTPAEKAAYGRYDALAQQIAETKALTVEGVAAQMDYFVADYGDANWDTGALEHKVIRSMHDGLQGLAGHKADEASNRRIIHGVGEDIQVSTFHIQGLTEAFQAVRDNVPELRRANSPEGLAMSALLHAIENETERLNHLVEKIDDNTILPQRAI